MAHVDALRGRLLLVHGGIDENVHFRHTARLMRALVRADKDFELLLFPDERHMPRSAHDRIYLERRVLRFLREGLSS
jgi:dipeptidyl-peptidase-4